MRNCCLTCQTGTASTAQPSIAVVAASTTAAAPVAAAAAAAAADMPVTVGYTAPSVGYAAQPELAAAAAAAAAVPTASDATAWTAPAVVAHAAAMPVQSAVGGSGYPILSPQQQQQQRQQQQHAHSTPALNATAFEFPLATLACPWRCPECLETGQRMLVHCTCANGYKQWLHEQQLLLNPMASGSV
jgi:hypothetical protein